MEDHINVAIRVRPLNQKEAVNSTPNALAQVPWNINCDTMTLRQSTEGRFIQGNSFTFDRVFGQKDATCTVYDNVVKGIIGSSMGGFNGTIFAYGQTSSGKTHTMYGSDSEPGIIKLAVREMFDIVESDTKREYLLRVSFLEIYNEVLRDLLEPSKTNLKIHENSKREIFVGDLSEHIVFNAKQVEDILGKGDQNRHIAGTNMNERSSRSHTIFRIVIESRDKAEIADGKGDPTQDRKQRLSTGSFNDDNEFTGAVMVSCLNLVDLAGSERVRQTGAEGQRLKEGAHINKSLLSLGTVIARLSEDGGDRGHVPYRDSKLTRILQPSLGGNARTLIICTVTPAQDYVDETISTLKFASRAKTIQNKPEVNEELRGDALLRRLKRASELEKEMEQMKTLEQRRVKVEADNESLLRQLWKSQKERERLQKELQARQKSIFSPHSNSKDKDNIDSSRRMTWFPGLSRNIGNDLLLTGDCITDDGSLDDTDDASAQNIFVDFPQRSQSSLETSNPEIHAVTRISSLELRVDSLEQQKTSLALEKQEMEATIKQLMREYNLMLSTLKQLSTAETIPPTPVKGGDSTVNNSPQEITQIRRKLRALMTTLSATQKQCQRLRSQRPEAEFLELELQAMRETLIEKEEQYVALMQESDELFTKFKDVEHTKSSLESICQELRGQITQIQDRSANESADYTKRIQYMTTEIAGSKSVITEREAAIKELETKVGSMLDQIDTLSREKSNLLSEANEANAKCNELELAVAESQVLSVTIDGYKAKIKSLEDRAESYDNEFQKRDKEMTKQQTKIGELTALVDKHRTRLSEMELSHSHELADRDSLIDCLRATHESELQRLSEDTRATTNKIQQHESTINMLRSEIDNLSLELIRAKESKEKACSKNTDLESKISAISHSAKENSEELRNELESLRLSNSELSGLLDKKQKYISKMSDDHTQMRANIEELEAQNSNLWERISELTVTNEELSSKLSDSNIANSDRQAHIDDLKTKVQKLADDLAASEKRISGISGSSSKEIATLNLKIQDLQKELDDKMDEISSSNLESKRLSESVDTLSSSYTLLEKEAAALERRASDAESRASSLETLLNETKKAQSDLEIEAARFSNEYDALIQKVNSQDIELKDLKLDISSVRKTNTELQCLNSNLSAEKANINDALSKATEELLSTNSELNTLRAENSSICNEVNTLKESMTELKTSYDNLITARDDKIQQLQSKLDSVHIELESLEAEVSEKDQSKNSIVSLNDSLRKELESSKSSLSQYISQLTELETSYSILSKKAEGIEMEKSEISSSLESKVALLEGQLKIFSQERDSLEKTRTHLESELENAKLNSTKDASSYKTTIAKLEDTCKALSDSSKATEIRAFEADKKISTLESELDKLNCIYKDTVSKLNMTEKTRDDAIKELDVQKSLVGQMSESADVNKRRLKDMSEKNAQTVQLLESKLKDAISEREGLNTQLQVTLNTLKTTSQEVLHSKQAIEQQKCDMDSLTKANASISAEKDERDSRICDLKDELSRVMVDMETLKAKNSKDQAKISKYDADFLDIHKVVDELNDKINNLTLDLARKEAEYATAIEKRDEAYTEMLSKASSLEAALEQHKHELDTARNKIDTAHNDVLAAQDKAANHASLLKNEIKTLEEQLSLKSADAIALSKELEETKIIVANGALKYDSLYDQFNQLQINYDLLSKNTHTAQMEMEQSISELKLSVDSKSVIIRDLELALENANSLAEAAKKNVDSEYVDEINRLKDKINELAQANSSTENELLSKANRIQKQAQDDLEAAHSQIEALTKDYEQEKERIEMIKSMMTELATVKNNEIAELESKLSQHEDLLESSIKNGLDKEQAIQNAQTTIETHASTIKDLERALEESASEKEQKMNLLVSKCDVLQTELDSSTKYAANLQELLDSLKNENSNLQEQIRVFETAKLDLESKIAEATEKKSLASSLSAESSAVLLGLTTIYEKLACVCGIDNTKDICHISGNDLNNAIAEICITLDDYVLTSKRDHDNIIPALEDKVRQLQDANAKLESKTAKLFEVYKNDTSELHIEREKHRLNAQKLGAQLSKQLEAYKDLEDQLADVRRNIEDQATKEASLSAERTKHSSVPLDSNTLARSHTTSSVNTPTKNENSKRLRITEMKSNGDFVTPLSPIDTNRLNAHSVLHNGSAKKPEQLLDTPARKRTAATEAPNARSSDIKKPDISRARSSYGNRRRIRATRVELSKRSTLEEQDPENCIQQ